MIRIYSLILYMEENKSRFYQTLLESYNQKLYLLKSLPGSFKKHSLEFEDEGTCYNLIKVYIKGDYTQKPMTYSNLSSKLDHEIFEEVDTKKFNFTKKNSNETIIYISGTEFYFEHEKCQYSDDYSTIVQNIFPLVNLHMLFLPLYSKILPQFLNDSAYTQRVLDLQEIIGESDLVICYNSKGGASSVNHLHFHFSFLREIGMTNEELGFNKNTKICLLKQIDLDESIYTNNIKINKISNCLKTDLQIAINYCENNLFKYYTITNDQSIPSKIRSETLQKFLDFLHANKIPYNIIILDKLIYVFPRRHENVLTSKKFACFEILGVYALSQEEEFEKFQFSQYKQGLTELWFDNQVYSSLNTNIKLINL